MFISICRKHGKQLYETIREREQIETSTMSMEVLRLTKEKIREITEKSDNAIISTFYGTFSTDINI